MWVAKRFLTTQFFMYREVLDAEFIVSEHDIVEMVGTILCAERRFILLRANDDFHLFVP
jgi:hypothetical protein